MARLRAFFAVHLSPEAIAELGRRVAALRRPVERAGLRVSWTRQEQQHVTVKFLGDVDEEAVPPMVERVRAGLAELAPGPVVLCAGGLGAFPSPARPSVIWAAVTDERGQQSAALLVLQGALEGWLEELGHAREQRPFQGHLTVGRVRGRHGNIAELLAGPVEKPGVASVVTELVLYESRQEPGGVVYRPLSRIPMKTGDSDR